MTATTTIRTDLDIFPTLPPGEGKARVYGEACDYVRARRLPPVPMVHA